VAYNPCGVSSTSQLLYKEFLNNLFRQGEHSLGRAVFAAKCSIIARNPADDNIYGPAVLWTLFGDPALRVRHRMLTGIQEGLKPQAAGYTLSVAPNPCHHSTTVRFSPLASRHSPLALSVYNASGRLVLSQPVHSSSFILPTSCLSAGVYIVELPAGPSATLRRKLVVR
jgi:hypothetical protein